ncbi:MAG TPA: PfkB family carbohydrate kinase [Anaerolineales bacterium]|nr:PfkB family carbohydrate kinase [Anaerolineales bacterium]
MTKNANYDVVCIGNYTKDTIVTPAGVEYTDGGAVNYASHAIAGLGLKVAVVTHLSKEDSRVVDACKDVGIDCYPTFTEYSTLMKLEYPTVNPDIRTLTVEHTAGSIAPSELVGFNGIKSAVIGTSLRGEVGLDVIKTLKEKQVLLGADVQGFVRVLDGVNLGKQPWEEMEETLAYIDILKSDAVEAEFLTGESDIYKAARIFAEMGPEEVVLTHKDGLLILANGQYFEMEFYPEQLKGRSGRGDTCLGTYIAMRLTKPPEEAGIWAAALTSLKMEKQGPFTRTIDDVRDLIDRKYRQ